MNNIVIDPKKAGKYLCKKTSFSLFDPRIMSREEARQKNKIYNEKLIQYAIPMEYIVGGNKEGLIVNGDAAGIAIPLGKEQMELMDNAAEENFDIMMDMIKTRHEETKNILSQISQLSPYIAESCDDISSNVKHVTTSYIRNHIILFSLLTQLALTEISDDKMNESYSLIKQIDDATSRLPKISEHISLLATVDVIPIITNAMEQISELIYLGKYGTKVFKSLTDLFCIIIISLIGKGYVYGDNDEGTPIDKLVGTLKSLPAVDGDNVNIITMGHYLQQILTLHKNNYAGTAPFIIDKVDAAQFLDREHFNCVVGKKYHLENVLPEFFTCLLKVVEGDHLASGGMDTLSGKNVSVLKLIIYGKQ